MLGKWEPRLVPALLVTVDLGPGGKCLKTYGMVKLSKLLGDSRPSRATIRRSSEITFPEVISFPLRQRLNLGGVIEDANAPSPAVADEAAGEVEGWNIIESDVSGPESPEHVEGFMQENKPLYKITCSLDEMLAIDPLTSHPEIDDPEPEDN